MTKPTLNAGFTRCPRCQGNLGLEYDPPGSWDVVCLQCGFRRVAVSQRRPLSRTDLFEAEAASDVKAA